MALTVMELAEEVRESNRRLTLAIDGLGQKLDNLRVEIAKDLGTININLEGFKGRVDSELVVAKWAAKVLTPAVFSLIVSVVGGAWYLTKVDLRLDTLVKQTSHVDVRPLPSNKSGQIIPVPTPNVSERPPVIRRRKAKVRPTYRA